ncbi:MAG: DDE transposase family protein [Calothrix sp. SM1_7_51]|nr:DDE transposase family protein [Calothrix sp. SM1_7_51]
MSENPQSWYIVKRPVGNCEIISSDKIEDSENAEATEKWGPFTEQGEAFARRVGLIRAGKCQPI